MYTADTVFRVQAFTRQPEGEDVIIGRIDTGVFLAVPSEAVEVLDHLSRGMAIGEAANLFQDKYGEKPDLDEFLGVLESKGILEPVVQGETAETRVAQAGQAPRVRYHFSNFSRSLAQRLFSRRVIAGSLAIVMLAFMAAARNPSLIPRPRDLYFPDRRALTWAILIGASYVTIFIHEFGHLVAARALGINSRIGISHRLWYLVAETDLTGLWSVPKRQRYLPMLAGVLIDAVSGSLLVLLLFAASRQWLTLPPLALRLARAMAFSYMMRILWQFFLFVRTDFYYVIASLFNCRNLLKDTQGFLRNQLARMLPFIRSVDQSAIPASERRVIRAYSVVWLAGRVFAFILLFAVTIPLAILYIGNLAKTFRSGFRSDPSDFLDALVVAAYFVIPTALGLTLWMGGLIRRTRS